MLRERYEQSHGIYDHKSSTDPYALVLMQWPEDSISSSTLRDRMEAFLNHRVAERMNLSWTQFLELPTYMCDLILEVLSSRKEDTSALDALANSLGK